MKPPRSRCRRCYSATNGIPVFPGLLFLVTSVLFVGGGGAKRVVTTSVISFLFSLLCI